MAQSNERQLTTTPPQTRNVVAARRSDNLADVLERVLDKGIVIAGDITISLATVELLSIKVRLLIASVDKAREIGIDWWQHDPALSGSARVRQQVREAPETALLNQRLDRLERQLSAVVPVLEEHARRRRRRVRSRVERAMPRDSTPSHPGK